MPTFTYTARDGAGQSLTGEVSAPTSAQAAKLLRNEGKYVVSLEVARAGRRAAPMTPPEPSLPGRAPSGGFSLTAPRLDPRDVRGFAQQLAVMLETGVSLSEALETCTDPKLSPGFARVLEAVIADVHGGSTFSSALARHPRAFPPLFVNMVRASEASGQLGPMLRRIADFMTRQAEVTRKIKGAVIYPIVMFLLAIGVVIFLMAFVLPRFATVYAGREQFLPWLTRWLMSLSSSMTQYGLYLLGGAVSVIAGLFFYLRGAAARSLIQAFKLKLPLFGPLFHKTYLARSLRTLGTLIQAGVSMLESVELTGSAVGNGVYARLWNDVYDQLQQGKQLSESVAASPLMPRAVVKMMQAGERGGTIGGVMDRVADHCEEELATDIKTMTSMLEPAIVMFLGVFVGGIVIALLLPIFTLSRAMRGH
ncbi:MAG: type II secretion system F family protein [Phycisphaerae bacterium]|nr:type II secretion system F family protein [Phycisphaerae bacterium]NUQ47224.1 type II secretion system F family protein [Phycisphaerae bacterium]